VIKCDGRRHAYLFTSVEEDDDEKISGIRLRLGELGESDAQPHLVSLFYR